VTPGQETSLATSCSNLRSSESSGVGGGGAGGASAPPTSFDMLKILTKSLKIQKIPKDLGKISENLGKNGTQRCLASNMAPNVCRKTSKRPFFGGHTNKRSVKFTQQLFGEVWEYLGKNPLHPQKIACS